MLVFRIEQGDIPKSLDNSLIFTKAALIQLKANIGQLEAAKASHREEFKQIRTTQVSRQDRSMLSIVH